MILDCGWRISRPHHYWKKFKDHWTTIDIDLAEHLFHTKDGHYWGGRHSGCAHHETQRGVTGLNDLKRTLKLKEIVLGVFLPVASAFVAGLQPPTLQRCRADDRELIQQEYPEDLPFMQCWVSSHWSLCDADRKHLVGALDTVSVVIVSHCQLCAVSVCDQIVTSLATR